MKRHRRIIFVTIVTSVWGECKCADGSPALDGEILQGEIGCILNDSKGGERDFYLEKLQMQKYFISTIPSPRSIDEEMAEKVTELEMNVASKTVGR